MLFLALLGKTPRRAQIAARFLFTKLGIHQLANAILASLAKPYHVVGG